MLPLLLLPLAAAKYSAIPVTTMIDAADVVVSGEIVAVEAETFTVEVVVSVDGPQAGETLEVLRYRDWTCSARWQPYAVGQQVVLLLVETDAGLRIQSAGGEGELPIIGEEVWVKMGLGQTPQTAIPESQVYGSPVPVEDFLDAVAVRRACSEVPGSRQCRTSRAGDSPTHRALLGR